MYSAIYRIGISVSIITLFRIFCVFIKCGIQNDFVPINETI